MGKMNGVFFADLPAICPEKGGLSPLQRLGSWQNNSVLLRLSGDAGYTLFSPASDIVGGGVEEVFWKCADMTDQTLFLKKPDGLPCDCILAWLRFEPMSEAED